ncbi:TPA: pyruvate kinase [Candidatus Saccharibacteria bacterium]|nr:pyruvate kinase [Candidatus Saccharibacteria bacterium]HRJ91249.1 pyruvate kinase [Candidatus Saccharibacteria bacterium]
MDTVSTPKFKRVKILATVGPATNSYEMIEGMLKAGVNGFRLNFSHGSNADRDEQIQWIRQASKKYNKPVAIYQDLQGPKIRLGEIEGNHMDVHEGDELRLVYGAKHDGKILPTQYDLSTKVKPGERIYIFDGKIKTTVTAVEGDTVVVRAENDGFIMSRKGLNLPDTDFGGDVLTEKDYQDIDYGVNQDIDFVGLSFVHRATDIEILRGYLAEKGSDAQIVAKIETRTAIEPDELEKIVHASDAVMVARGDLAVEVGAELVPVVQRRIIGLCQRHAKISIVATQMMSSMVDNPEPTRAEVSDVSNAVIVGADCVMLSDETAVGKYPLETIRSMKRVIMHTQEHAPVRPLDLPEKKASQTDGICAAAKNLATQLDAQAIIAETKSGATAVRIAAHRPSRPIVSVTSTPRVAQQLALLYANKSFLRPDGEKAGLELAKELMKEGFFASPATFVLVSGRQPGLMGATDTIRVRVLE